MKRCPFCAEEIQSAAIKCKHCGEKIGGGNSTPLYFRHLGMFVAFLCVGPLMLPLVWWSPNHSRSIKVVLTIAISVVTGLLGWATVQEVQSISEYYRILEELGAP